MATMINNSLKIYKQVSNTLGEGLFVSTLGVFWLDIKKAKLFCLFNKKSLRVFQLPEQASAVWKIESDIIYLASESGICTFNLLSQDWCVYASYSNINKDMRANDGCLIDGETFLFGTMQKKPTGLNGSLYIARSNEIAKIYDGIGIPNTFIKITESSFLISDSLEQIVYLFTLNNSLSEVIDKSPWLDLSMKSYTPDGGCKDREGNIYLALWDGSCINKYDKDANFLASFELPVLRPTNCKLSVDGNSLYVTSAKEDLTTLELNQNPYSGALFQIGLCSKYE
jgi:sugar lactone lactonase YvrE